MLVSLLLTLLACDPAPPSPPPPWLARTAVGDLPLETRWLDGALALKVVGLEPGQELAVGVSTVLPGRRVCKPQPCLRVGPPITRATLTADASGVARWRLDALEGRSTGRAFVQVATTGEDRRRSPVSAVVIPVPDDRDGDLLSDAAEAVEGTDPDAADSDGDGLDDGWEAALRTNPTAADSDGDGTPDGTEWWSDGTHPGHSGDTLPEEAGDQRRSDDADNDGVPDDVETARGSDPNDPDSDGDGVPDAHDAAPAVAHPPFTASDRLAVPPTGDLPDPEFEQTEGLLTWSTANGSHLYVAAIDPTTRDLVPPDGRGVLIDEGVAPISLLANGPEWVQTARGPEVVYVKMVDGEPLLARAWREGGTWRHDLLPGRSRGASPFGTLNVGDPDPLVFYCRDCDRDRDDYSFRWRKLLDPSVDHPLRKGPTMGRWVDGMPALMLQVRRAGTSSLFLYDTRTLAAVRLTEPPEHHALSFVWPDPQQPGTHLAFSVVGSPRDPTSALQVWRWRGGSELEPLRVIDPPYAFPYVVSPEPVVFGGRSYISFLASTGALNKHNGTSEVWMAEADVDDGRAWRVSDDTSMVRKDPETLVLGGEVLVYYTEVTDDDRRVLHVTETGLRATPP